MTEELPDPLVPADVDLRDFQYTPIFRARLFGSSFHARTTDAEWRAGVTLWLKSWDQVPAGTLPDDEIDLCRLAEFGRDIKGWRKVRAGALHGWRKCSDGRLHHEVVAEGVLEAHGKRKKAKAKGLAGASKRWGAANSTSISTSNSTTNAQAIARAMPGDSKGREGKGIEGKPKSSAVNSTTVAPAETARAASDSKDKATQAGEWAADLKRRGVSVTSAHPTLLAWISDGFTLPQVIEALGTARDRKPEPETIPANYLDRILRDPPKKAEAAWWSSEKLIIAKGIELGLNPRPGEEIEGFKSRIVAAIVAAKDGKGMTQQRSEAA